LDIGAVDTIPSQSIAKKIYFILFLASREHLLIIVKSLQNWGLNKKVAYM